MVDSETSVSTSLFYTN